ncbi:NAD/NADP octopine/nopaline dehydrogenase family protein [Reyranella sp.]|uniref:NAD/NADP octopine/nopaline dehydrogenase family protein n=1 Tax=Reyranella sp. TaxID=1929291 RepID=UPI003F72ADFF
MKIGIVGAGAIAFGMAAFLEQAGHAASLWSPSGARTKALAAGEPLVAAGAIEGSFTPRIATSPADVVTGADVILIALPAYGHKHVFDAIAPHVTATQTVIVSSHASFGALYLSRLLAARSVTVPVIAWGTTLLSGRQTGLAKVQVNTVRKAVDLATLPASRSAEGLALCKSLFGDRFVDRGNLLAIALSNLNPTIHMGIALGNMTRMEKAEAWGQAESVTPNVGRLLEELDRERLAIAASLGLDVRTIFQHLHLSFGVPYGSASEMHQAMHVIGKGGAGPTTADSRYVTEDVPFGLVPTAKLGRLTGHPAPLHEAGIALFSAMYGRDFTAENDLLAALDIDALSLGQLQTLCRDGYAPLSS